MNNHQLANDIVNLLGGKENISQAMHCVTRLRFYINDDSKTDMDEIKKLKGVIQAQVKNGQYQVVIGPNVGEVFEEVQKVLGLTDEEQLNSNKPKKKITIKTLFESMIDLFAGVFVPFLPALVAGGMIKGISAILVSTSLVQATNGTLQLFSIISDVPFYFMPFFLALSMAKRLHVSEQLSLVIAGTMMYPTFVELIGAKVNPIEFFGFTVPVFKYASTVFPIMFGVGLLSLVYKRIDRYTPKMIKIIVVPTLSVLIVVPVTLLIFAPIGAYMGIYLADGMLWLFDTFGPIMAFALGFFYPLLVMTGMNQSYGSVTIYNLDTYGADYTLPISLVSNFSQAGAAFGIGLRTKNIEERSAAFATSFSSIIGISEPAMYTVNLPHKKPFLFAMIASGLGSALTWLLGVKCYAYVMPGLFSLPNYINSNGALSNLVGIIICILSSFTLAAVLTILFQKKTSGEVESELEDVLHEESAQKKVNDIVVLSPIEGDYTDLVDVKDEVFSSGKIGKGFGVFPNEDIIYAPCDGVVEVVMDSKHAIMIRGENNAEILIHMGIDTVNLQGQLFETFVQKGQHVKQGEILSKVDVKALQDNGYDPTVIVVCTNSNQFDSIKINESPVISMEISK